MDAYRPRHVDAVVIEKILEFVSTVRDRANGSAHGGFGRVEHRRTRRDQGVRAVSRGQDFDRAHANAQGCDLRLQVTHDGHRLANILRDQSPKHVIAHAPGEKLRGRNAQPLLINFGRIRGIAAGRHAADIEMMAERADDRDAFSLGKNRAESRDVRQVLAAAIGIVRDDDIALFPEVGRNEPVEDRLQKIAHGIEVLRNARRLRHVIAIRIEDGRRVVEHLAHDGRAAGPPHRDVHLRRRSRQRVAQHFEFDCVEHAHANSSLRAATR